MEIGFLRFGAREHVDKLEKAMEVLKDKQSDVKASLPWMAEAFLEDWSDEVDTIEREVADIKDDMEQGGCLFLSLPLPLQGSCFSTCGSSPSLVKRSMDAHAKVDDLITQHAWLSPYLMRRPKFPKHVWGRQYNRDTVGMDLNLEKLRSFLTDDRVGIVGIWGEGGVGKSALLKKLKQSMIGDGNMGFDHVVHVSRLYFNVDPRTQIARKLKLLETDADSILNFLRGRRFLILFDEYKYAIDLDELGIPNREQSSLKSKVVFATRTKTVCEEMGADEMIEVAPLEPEDAYTLFKQVVNNDSMDSDKRIDSITRDLAKEIGGVPRGLIGLGGPFSRCKSLEQWKDAYTLCRTLAINFSISYFEADDFDWLGKCFDFMDDNTTKECFPWCSLWPGQDRLVYHDELIVQYWMGPGLIGNYNDDFSTIMSCGHNIIRQLMSGTILLEPIWDSDVTLRINEEARKSIWLNSRYRHGDKWIVREGVGLEEVNVEEWSDAIVVALMDNHIKELPQQLPNFDLLRTFIFQQSSYLNLSDRFEIPTGFFQHMLALTYLDLSGCHIYDLPADIDCLVQLRYLNLSSTKITSLPDKLGGLQQLQFLILRKMPFDFRVSTMVIQGLDNLRVLRIER